MKKGDEMFCLNEAEKDNFSLFPFIRYSFVIG